MVSRVLFFAAIWFMTFAATSHGHDNIDQTNKENDTKRYVVLPSPPPAKDNKEYHSSLPPLPPPKGKEHSSPPPPPPPKKHFKKEEEPGESGVVRGDYSFYHRYDPRAPMTCDKFPRVCRAKGSPGPDCCYKRCVNVMTDNLNCGRCGHRCKYGQACCGGECVSIMYDPRHCGGCKKKCKKGSYCRYGMCSYAT